MCLMTLVCPERVRTRKVTRNSCVFHVMKGFREAFSVIKDGDGKWQGGKFSSVGKEGKMVFQYPVAREGRESEYFLGLGSQTFRFDFIGAGLKWYRWKCFRRA